MEYPFYSFFQMENYFRHSHGRDSIHQHKPTSGIEHAILAPPEDCLLLKAEVYNSLDAIMWGIESATANQQNLNQYVIESAAAGGIPFIIEYASGASAGATSRIIMSLANLPEPVWHETVRVLGNNTYESVMKAVDYRRSLEADFHNLIDSITPDMEAEDHVDAFKELLEDSQITHSIAQAELWADIVWGVSETEQLEACKVARECARLYLPAVSLASSFSPHASIRREAIAIARDYGASALHEAAVDRLRGDTDPVVRYDADRLPVVELQTGSKWLGGAFRENRPGQTEVLAVWAHPGGRETRLDCTIFRFRRDQFQQASGRVDQSPKEIVPLLDDWHKAGTSHCELGYGVYRRILQELPRGGTSGSLSRVKSRLWAEYAASCLA